MTVPDGDAATVAVFADHGPLVNRIAETLRERGATTHTISVEAGWVASVSRAVVVLDSAAGMSAMRDLSERAEVFAHVVALLPAESDEVMAELCDRCAERHHLVTIRSEDVDVVDRVADEVMDDHLT